MIRRKNHLQRASVDIAVSYVNLGEWDIRAAANYLMRRDVPLHVALRVLAGRSA